MKHMLINLKNFTTFIALAMTLTCAAFASAATIPVTNSGDSGAGSLRAALASAVNGDTIDATGISGAIFLTSGELLVDKSVTINGPGAANLAVNGNASSRVFHVGSGRTVTIAGLTITNGHVPDLGGGIYNDHATLTVINCTLSGNSSDFLGGGIYIDGELLSATLMIANSTLSGNSAIYGAGGIYSNGNSGSATLTMTNSTLSDNWTEYGDGAGIFNYGNSGSATLMMTNSTLSDNWAGIYVGHGGGIYNDSGDYSGHATVTITNSTLSGNSASGNYVGEGGGIFNNGFYGSATLTITNSTLSGNSALYGGGICNLGAYGSPTLTITNSTLSGNSAILGGGGIFNNGNYSNATLTITNSTLSGNSGGFGGDGVYNYLGASLEIGSTILNAGGGSSGNIINDFGTVTSLGYNLSSDAAGSLLTDPGDQINTDPMLGPLQDNGGPTFTHALLPGSPAIDAGDPVFTPPPDYDQRGFGYSRVLNSRIDIGAFEAQPTATPSYAGQVQPPINADGTSTFSVRRGVVPVKFNLTLGGVATCDLPPATIAVTRTAGGVIGQVNESVYSGNADTGSNFRIDSCEYVYNLNSRVLGIGTYRVDVLIDGQIVGSAVFTLN